MSSTHSTTSGDRDHLRADRRPGPARGRAGQGTVDRARLHARPARIPFDAVAWELRSAKITGRGRRGRLRADATSRCPKSWSQLATNVVVSKYFRGHLGTPDRERSVKQLIGRVVGRIREWGDASGYFATPDDSQTFARRADPPARDAAHGLQQPGLVQPRRRRTRRSRRAPASSTPSTTPWSRSWTSPRPRRCCSRAARAPARTSRRSAPRASGSRAAAPRRARSRSCAASTPSRAS